MFDSANDALENELVSEARERGFIAFEGNRVEYRLNQQKSYAWNDPEEWVRAHTIAWLVLKKKYPTNRLRTEVNVPRRTPNDFADVIVFRDDACTDPYLVVENKASGQSESQRAQGIEQLFGNANSLRAPLGLYDEGEQSAVFNVLEFPGTERMSNRIGTRESLPEQYGETPEFNYIAGGDNDIQTVNASTLGSRIRRAHYIIWAGGRRDPLLAFDEWSKLLFAKVIDERTTPTGQPRRFQVGTGETSAAVANRVHALFREAARSDPSIFPSSSRINLADSKITSVVECLQAISFSGTDIDSVGQAFEAFFGAIFRGELGQYFTMRQLARFTVGMLEITPSDYVLDPTAGSGGFLLEALLQTWHNIDRDFAGQSDTARDRLKTDFALSHVFGIEIHEILARICKINLLLHHDGHTNIEADRSCLDAVFLLPRLNRNSESFSCIVGNPPFGDEVQEGDEDHLGSNSLVSFELANGRRKIDSEQVILERCIQFLEPQGRRGLVLPDGLLNNQGRQSNCPNTRIFLPSHGRITAIVSLPDHAFRKSGAQNKTSILFFSKWSKSEKRKIDRQVAKLLQEVPQAGVGRVIAKAVRDCGLDYPVFLAEAIDVGYTPAGLPIERNDLFRLEQNGILHTSQENTILGEWRIFQRNASIYKGRTQPDCMSMLFSELWGAHQSHRLDPKYHLFQREANAVLPPGWVKAPIRDLMRRRTTPSAFDSDALYTVLTIAQTGELRAREPGKGNNPPEWLGEYFEQVSPGDWFAVQENDVVFSGIDLWKGCIAVVPPQFNGALVTKEFPIYEVTDERITPEFLQVLLRSRYYQRAFRAITTGHSNRRRTQDRDFEAVEIAFPVDVSLQHEMIAGLVSARSTQRDASRELVEQWLAFSNRIDGRGAEPLPDALDESE